MDDAARICARLLAAGTIPRAELRELDHAPVRAEVEERLGRCGLTLASSAYSDFFGLRISSEASDPTVLDAATNLGMKADACALLTILWIRLALPKRVVEEGTSPPGGPVSLIPGEDRAEARNFTPFIRFETLAREFAAHMGGRVRMKMLLSQLRRLGFVRYKDLQAIEAGPLLELGIDGERMASFVRTRVLSRYVAIQAASGEGPAPGSPIAERILAVLRESDEPMRRKEIETRSGLPAGELRRMLEYLREQGDIEMLGMRGTARYRLLPRGAK
jgi:hypothetical protein